MADRLKGRSRLGFSPEMRDLVRRIESVDTITGLEFDDNVILADDDRYIAFGDNGVTDSYITFDGTDLKFFDSTVGVAKTLTQLSAAVGASIDNTFDVGKTIDGATSETNALQVGGTNDKLKVWEEASNDVRMTTTTGANLAITANGGYVNILSDSCKLGFGADGGATDAYIYFNGTDLLFYDSHYASTIKLSDLAGSNLATPTVTGDMTFTDGKCTLTDAADEVALVITSSAVVNPAVQVHVNSATTGGGIYIAATEGTLNGGYYVKCYDNTATATVFSLKEDGEIEITGAAGSDMITISAGDLQIDNGKYEVDTTQDITSYVKRNNATSTAAVLEVEQTHVGSTGSALLVDQKATGNAIGLEITHAGDYAAIDISASAARTGDVIKIAMANQLAQKAINITGAEVAANNQGVIDVRTTGALDGSLCYLYQATGAPTAASHVLELTSAGNLAGANDGACLKISETGAAQATSYAVYITSTSNEALKVGTGESLFAEKITVNDDVAITTANTSNVDSLTVTQNDTTNNKDGIVAVVNGTGKTMKVTTGSATGTGAHFITAASQTTSNVTLDGSTNNWIGANGVGMLHIVNDGTHAHANASMVKIAFSGTSANGEQGTCLRLDDTGTSGGGTEYSLYINSTNHEAIKVDAGKVVVDETLTASGGIISKHSVADITHAAPTAAELASAFGFTTAGQIGTVDDAGGAANCFMVFYDGTNYWYSAFTKAL